jgi:type IV secretion system protein VirB4
MCRTNGVTNSYDGLGSNRTRGYAIYHHIIRREAEVSLDADYRDDFSRRLDSSWRAKLSTKRLYINDLFLTLVRRPLQGPGDCRHSR